jgi:hypothetical protein
VGSAAASHVVPKFDPDPGVEVWQNPPHMLDPDCSWILDSGGAGRGAWQGGVLHRFMEWARANGRLPLVTMGASAGGYAAADVATGTERTVMKGWTWWGKEPLPVVPGGRLRSWRTHGLGAFRAHLHASVHYVMDRGEVAGIFDGGTPKKLLVFTTRVQRRDGRPFGTTDMGRYFLKSATRKLPPALKYLPGDYLEELVIFAANLPEPLHSPWVQPLARDNFHLVLEASCLVPVAMGEPFAVGAFEAQQAGGARPENEAAVLMDGGFTAKMPMAIFEEDSRYQPVARWAATRKSIVFCCDPHGILWENSSRLRRLNDRPGVRRAIEDGDLLVVFPDHAVEAGFLCTDNEVIMRTFRRGQEQGDRLLRSDEVRRFLEDDRKTSGIS